jgi:hypothetical protein
MAPHRSFTWENAISAFLSEAWQGLSTLCINSFLNMYKRLLQVLALLSSDNNHPLLSPPLKGFSLNPDNKT